MLDFNMFFAIRSNFNVKLKREGGATSPTLVGQVYSREGWGGLAPPSLFSFTLKS